MGFRVQILLHLIFWMIGVAANAQTELYVSPTGNDKNPGNRQRPFATLARAQMAARKLDGKVTVNVRGGTYYLGKTLVFRPEDTRKKGAELVFKGVEGEKVILSGAVPLSLAWTDYRDGIKMAPVNQDIVFDQLFVNGQRQPMARYPNYQPEKAHFGGYAADAISKERAAKWKDPAGGFVHAMHMHEWGDFHYLITGKNSDGEVQLEGGFQNNRKMGMHDQYRFVEHIFEELDTLGEWFYDKEKRILYYKPSPGLSEVRVEVPQLRHLVEFRGSEARPVSNISLAGFEFTHTTRTFMDNKEPLLRSDWTIYRGGAILLEGAENCQIRDSRFNAVGSNAIFFSNYNRDHVVSGCEITLAGASAICFVGDPKAARSPSFEYNEFVAVDQLDKLPGPKSNNYPARCKVYDNLIHDIGRIEKQIAGVEISMAQDITVSHNSIYNVPRSGINISEGTWGGHIIEFNDVFNTVLETGDHGSFNSWGRDRFWHPNYDTLSHITERHPELVLLDVVKTIVIRNNRFRCDHGWDIDLDDGSSNYHIYNNLCLNGGLKLREGFHRVVENNIMVNNSFHPHVWFKNSGDVFRHNIVMRNYYPIRLQGWGTEVDYNLFPDSISLAKARQEGTDAHSAFGSPGFINPKTGDYRVADGSPALKLGFKNFPMDNFGVASPSLRNIALPVPLPELFENREVKDHRYEWMGSSIKNLNTLGERSSTGMVSETGVYVLDVMTWSPWSGYLKPGDVILGFNKDKIDKVTDLEHAYLGINENTPIELVIFRDQREQRIKITLKK
ncbi:PDZ domain-containing protein [Dyadobacter sp. 50-39]|uniref:PDZ domain-containing protein n=1 Tax=Dyadobacter sp. 50-39 TaxID=1895756 RepID=UPI000B15A265|nr:PDZ domain-containing protein [Dyadobacter sp. 50-39]